jgi:hypothetical protein
LEVQGVPVYRLEDHELISLLGRRVRVRKGMHTFEGMLIGPSEKKFPRGPNRSAYGCVVEGKDFRLDFAWWDWKIMPLASAQRIAAE